MNQPCQKTEVIDMIREDVKDIRSDVKLLLADKYKAKGISMVIMFVISSAVAIIAKLTW